MSSLVFILSADGNINVTCEGKNYAVSRSHPNYTPIKKAIRENNIKDFLNLVDIPKNVSGATNDELRIEGDVVYYKNNKVNDKIGKRIIQLMQEALPFAPLLRFLDRVNENPSKRSADELFNFLDHRALPLTEDGYFYAYKRVNSNWKDFYTNTLDNSIGKKVSMSRNKVDDDFRNDCSYGLHVGSIAYVQDFNAGEGHIVIVKVDPANVVSVPLEYSSTKCRVCEYDVICEYTGDLDKSPVYNEDVVPVRNHISQIEDHWDEDYSGEAS